MKAEMIEQNLKGDMFCVAYIDDGVWKFVVFNEKEVMFGFNVNEEFDIDNYTIPISGFSQPFANCCFLDNDNIFFNFFHTISKTHYHFVYDPFKKCIVHDLQKKVIKDCTSKNFPLKCLYI